MGPGTARRLALPATLGRYELLAPIASGGAATVYIAIKRGKARFERTVAIKVLHNHLALDEGFVSSFFEEARIAARIQHPNVVPIHDIDSIDDQLIMVMDYVEGVPLSALLGRCRETGEQLPLGVGLTTVHDALRGLQAAHELCDTNGERLELIHRDVSPQNILVGTDGVSRITDFGIAKARGHVTHTVEGAVKGKLRYLAPEQVTGDGLDQRVDLYAMGVVLWETLVGERMVGGDSEGEILMQLINKEPTAPSERRADVSPELDAVCLRALSRKPSERYQSAQAFADALDEVAAPLFFRPHRLGAGIAKLGGKRIARLQAALGLAGSPSHDSRVSGDFQIESERSSGEHTPSGEVPIGSAAVAELTYAELWPSSGDGPVSSRELAVSRPEIPTPSEGDVASSADALAGPSSADLSFEAAPKRRGLLPWAGGAALLVVGGIVWLALSGGDSETQSPDVKPNPTVKPASQSNVPAPAVEHTSEAPPPEPTAPPSATEDAPAATSAAPEATTSPPRTSPPPVPWGKKKKKKKKKSLHTF